MLTLELRKPHNCMIPERFSLKIRAYSIVLFLGMAVFGLPSLNATHIVGGEMNYRCLGNDQYEISLTVFRDCENGVPPFDDPAHVGIFDSEDELLTEMAELGVVNIDFIMDDTLDPTLFDSCLVIPPEVCVHVTTYVDTIALPFRSGGYNIVYQRCCRNHTILNIVAPDSTGATYSIYITEKALLECNSNAVFKEWPPTYICADVPIVFDHSALDPDGDSLVYKMCTPFHGGEFSCIPNSNFIPPCSDPQQPCGPRPCPPFNPPFDDVVWIPPFGLNNMLGGMDPLTIDSETGLLTGTPVIIVEDQVNQFVVGICVEEYRNGELISMTRRDFQYNVGVCGEAISSFFAPEVDCDGFSVDFDNQSEDAVDFFWDFGDPSTTSDISTLDNPSYVYPDTGLYEIMLIAGPNEACADTSYSYVSVQKPSLFVDFDLSIIDGCVFPAQVSFDDLTYDTISALEEWHWEFSNGDTSNVQDPVWYVTEPGTYAAMLTVTAANGCEVSHTAQISIDVLNLGLQDSARICNGNSAILNPGTDQSYSYTWSPGNTLNNINLPSPTATPLETTTYYLTVEDNQGCIHFDSIEVQVQEVIVNIADNLPICVGDTIFLHNGNEPGLFYNWSPNINIINPNTGSPLAHPENEITYYVTVTDEISGCNHLDSVRVVPLIDEVLIPSSEICEGESVGLNQFANFNFEYEWTPPLTLDNPNIPNPVATPEITTTYYVDILDVATNCIQKDSVIVLVNPLPINPNDTISACNNIESELNPNANPNYTYTWSPTTGMDDPNTANPMINISASETYYVTVVNPVTLCETVDTVFAFVPLAVEVEASNDEIVCDPSLDISAMSNTGQTLEWFSDEDLTNFIGSGTEIPVIPGPSSTYYVLATDEYGCTATSSITVGSRPAGVDAAPEAIICQYDSLSILANNLNPDDVLEYTWSPEDIVIAGAGTGNPTFYLENDDVITLVVENQFGCTDTLMIPVDVVENNLDVIATADPDSIYPGESSQLDATQGNAYNYEWTYGDLLDDDMIQNPLATPFETTTFTVFVEDEIGCKDTASVTVYLKSFFCEEPYIFIPNAFTPDGDGKNDIFRIRGNALDEVYLAVYNRWGEKVFETRDLETGWDGTYKGKELPPDVFGFYMEVKCLNGEEYFKKGNVTLLR